MRKRFTIGDVAFDELGAKFEETEVRYEKH